MTNETHPSNVLETPVLIERTAEPCLMVIFGASGDLSKRKLIPALFDLHRSGALPSAFTVAGIGRTPYSNESFRDHLLEAMKEFQRISPSEGDVWNDFATRLHYVTGDPADRDQFMAIRDELKAIDAKRRSSGNILFYLATPPSLYEPIIRNIDAAEMYAPQSSSSWTRIIIEKPFGVDLESARRLNATVLSVFTEDQVYRIDHYLGKETVQNLLVFRFANGIFEPLWNRNYVDCIQITAAETVGVESRGAYYEEAGALRDMVQNHLLQVLALTAMEPPTLFDARQVRDEKQKVFQAMTHIPSSEVQLSTVRGQYAEGAIGGKRVPGYRSEHGVSPESQTETYVALRIAIDNWRWAGVPFFIRTGKRLPERLTEVVVHFRQTPHRIFSVLDPRIAQNGIAIRIQPDEGISLRFITKTPGSSLSMQPVSMDFKYETSFRGELVEAYTRLLLDAVLGDQTLYARGDSVDTAWTFVTPILEGWKSNPLARVFPYPAGTWGPPEADQLLQADGRLWRRLL
jgi:glucose-6-phosphate 1-dehydrogenase